jgi:hypothetical protein
LVCRSGRLELGSLRKRKTAALPTLSGQVLGASTEATPQRFRDACPLRRGCVQHGGKHAREDVAQGSRFSLAALPPRRGSGGADKGRFSDCPVRGAGSRGFRLSCLRRGKYPRCSKCRRAGGRAVRYSFPSLYPQIGGFESKGKLAIVNPPRRMGCAALMPEYSFTLDHCQGRDVCATRDRRATLCATRRKRMTVILSPCAVILRRSRRILVIPLRADSARGLTVDSATGESRQ